ncbi:hypothetical protein ACIQD3_07510 [Peribacillus loiseleuriae]|uniref:hypothetical protein n=1 Tax=Peribacillus loiseleuriae TaxID=1679170 RepID=UPI003804DB55
MKGMFLGEFLFWTVIIVILLGANYLIFKIAGINRKKRAWGGATLLLLSPVVFSACVFIGVTSGWGFGAGFLAVIYTLLFVVNGLIVLIISFFTNRKIVNY